MCSADQCKTSWSEVKILLLCSRTLLAFARFLLACCCFDPSLGTGIVVVYFCVWCAVDTLQTHVYKYTYIYIYTCIDIHIYIYICIYTVCRYIYIYMNRCDHTYYTYIRIHECVYGRNAYNICIISICIGLL